MKKETIGGMLKDLKNGKIVQCPECKEGKIVPVKENDIHFKCKLLIKRPAIDNGRWYF
ncbi:hypothetical protein MR857_07355 [bacterium]|uniref:hypothetical protein n=1 Tax=Lachnospiraceae TaxID=186803 RepID=UPI0015B7CD33|nr:MULTISPECIES: hypothetical protein [Lachnospiraceae]MCI6043142.1 hypothetical protein [bacterium]MCI6432384.1 hypothetical protein [Lachnospiraceae bacterium]MDY2593998.1 hypothetical protein [Oliverpabstia sp.]MDY3716516.1 hypothetical protein [Blautia sp.]MDY3819144.1 hypothetical protein [Lachnospiraceae bacterium]